MVWPCKAAIVTLKLKGLSIEIWDQYVPSSIYEARCVFEKGLNIPYQKTVLS